MFPPMEVEGENFYLKPMNCPHHHMIYKSRARSYRDLPLRLAEYGTCYRYEDSGALAGLLRVRMLSMNDAHIYCQPEKLREEFKSVLQMHEFYYKKFKLSDYWMRLSTHDPTNTSKYVQDPSAWEESENVIREVLEESGLRFQEISGEAAFYGPKVDFQIQNVIGREETASTNQLDFAMPKKFDLSYVNELGKRVRPWIIHRAPLGTHERFIAFLIEHFGGAFPTWLSPVQAMVIPVNEKFAEYASETVGMMRKQMIRAEASLSSESLNKRIRNAVTSKIPNILIVGGREVDNQQLTWRRYVAREQETMDRVTWIEIVRKIIDRRLMDNFVDESIEL